MPLRLLKSWPRAVPDYRWPAEPRPAWAALRRWLAAALFHAGHAAGRVVGGVRRNRRAVLVLRTDGIGDAVMAEPMLASLAERFAGCELHLWAPAATCELFRANPCFARRLVIPRGFKQGNLEYFRSFRLRTTLGYRLGRWRFETAAYLVESPEPLGNWLLASVRAVSRWYNPGDTENQFSSQRTCTALRATALVSSRNRAHELRRNAHAARHWGGAIEDRVPAVHLDAAARAASDAQQRVWRDAARRLGATGGVVGLMPAGSMPVKRYPTAGWAAVAAGLWQRRRVACTLLGGPADAGDLADLSRRLADVPHLRLARPLDLPATAALLAGLDGLVSTDTGLAHIALALDVPTVVLCGGGHPGRFFPWPVARRAAVLTHAVPCAGCACRCKLAEAECLTKIDPEEAVAAMAGLLGSARRIPLRVAG